jgi:hypothetical protein
MLSRLIFWLYRWQLSRSGPRGTEHELVFSASLNPEYTTTMPAIWAAKPRDVTGGSTGSV